jgi:hypothetical protein
VPVGVLVHVLGGLDAGCPRARALGGLFGAFFVFFWALGCRDAGADSAGAGGGAHPSADLQDPSAGLEGTAGREVHRGDRHVLPGGRVAARRASRPPRWQPRPALAAAPIPPPSAGMPRAADVSLPCAPAANRKDEGDAAGARAREILAVRRRAADGVCGALISRGELDAAPAQTRFQKGTHAGTAPARVQRAAIVLLTLLCVRSRFVAHADTTGGATSRGGGRGLV